MHRQPQHPCPTCHGFARVRTADKQVACARCGTVLTPLPYEAGRKPAGTLPYLTPLRVGMKARIGGKEFYNVGRIRYTQSEAGETYQWEEWVLLHPDGDARYLEYDEGKWTLSEPFQPAQAPTAGELSAATDGGRYTVDGKTGIVKDRGACKVSGVEGEIPWPVRQGDVVRYVEMEAGDSVVSAEPMEDGTVEWYRGRRLDDRAVYTYFDLRELITALDRREQTLKGRKGFGLICLLSALIALFGWGAAFGRGPVVGEGSTALSAIPAEGLRFGPFALNAANRVHRLRVSSNLSQSSAWVQAMVEEEGAGELFGVDGDFWDETGYDSDGAWHEYNLQSVSNFRLSEPGKIYVRLYAERAPGAAPVDATVSFALEEKGLHSTYLGTFGILSLLAGGAFLIAGSPDTSQKVWQSMKDSD